MPNSACCAVACSPLESTQNVEESPNRGNLTTYHLAIQQKQRSGKGVPKRTPISVRAVKHRKYNFQVAVPPELNGGKRERKYFVLRKDAQSFASDLQVQKENFGTRLLQIPEALRQEALDCAGRLQPFQATLTEAIAFFIRHRDNTRKSCTFSELLEKLLQSKKTTGRCKRYLNDLRRIGGEFAREYGAQAVSEISPDDVENWAANDKHGPTTRNNRLRTLNASIDSPGFGCYRTRLRNPLLLDDRRRFMGEGLF